MQTTDKAVGFPLTTEKEILETGKMNQSFRCFLGNCMLSSSSSCLQCTSVISLYRLQLF